MRANLYGVLTAAVFLAGIFGRAGAMEPFALSQVRLEEGVFQESMAVGQKVLDDLDVDRALYAFRFQAGLPTQGAKPLEGWARPEPGGAFPGFFEGHYLSAISLMYAQTGERKWLDEVDYMVAELAKCQEAMGGNYLFASPIEELAPDRLDGVAWYRMHKIMEGLLAAHRFAGNAQALVILKNMSVSIKKVMDGYEADKAWGKVKRVEYGGMQEAFENLYELTRDETHREMAHQWEQAEMFERFHRGDDFTEHANTMLAKMVGMARRAEIEKESDRLQAVQNFWEIVVESGHKTYATGGTSVHEGMPGRNSLANTQARMAQETCCSYNLLKVTRSLFHLTGDAKYMDYYERTLCNAILGSQDWESGFKTYYQPLNANAVKDFRSHFTGAFCCNGTGLENPAKYGEAIYAHDAGVLYVNLFIASALDWNERGVRVEQATRFPLEPASRLTLRMERPTALTVALRVPGWAQDYAVRVNGEKIEAAMQPSSYVRIERTWQDGDTVDAAMTMPLRAYAMSNQPNQMMFMAGPIALVGVGAYPWLGQLVGDLEDEESWANRLDEWFQPTPGEPLRFTAKDGVGRKIAFAPYYAVSGEEFFTGYWDVVTTPTHEAEGNVALGKPTIADEPNPYGTNVECFLRSAKAVDGLYGGGNDWYVKWFPNGMAPRWMIVDLEAPHLIEAIEWFPAEEDFRGQKAYRYRIECSEDNETWKTYADVSENDEALRSYRHEREASARYVKFTFLKQPEEGNFGRPKLAELKVFGTPKHPKIAR